jgi:hypothetical protein
MKLLNLKQFRELPNGVVFAKYSTCNFEEWQIKSDTWESDFLSQPLLDIDSDTFGNHVDACLSFDSIKEAGVDFHNVGRDGLFEAKQLFAVLEKHEVRGLIERLEQTLVEGYSNV